MLFVTYLTTLSSRMIDEWWIGMDREKLSWLNICLDGLRKNAWAVQTA